MPNYGFLRLRTCSWSLVVFVLPEPLDRTRQWSRDWHLNNRRIVISGGKVLFNKLNYSTILSSYGFIVVEGTCTRRPCTKSQSKFPYLRLVQNLTFRVIYLDKQNFNNDNPKRTAGATVARSTPDRKVYVQNKNSYRCLEFFLMITVVSVQIGCGSNPSCI